MTRRCICDPETRGKPSDWGGDNTPLNCPKERDPEAVACPVRPIRNIYAFRQHDMHLLSCVQHGTQFFRVTEEPDAA